MGEVYLAEDTKLGRKVALRLLPAEFTRDAGRQVLLDLHFEVETHLRFHLAFVSSPAQQGK